MRPHGLHDLTVDERARLGQLFVSLGEQDWDRPTPCASWTVRDVLAHLVAWDDLLLHTTRRALPGSLARWAAAMVGARFDAHRLNDAAVGHGADPTVQLARFHAGAEPAPRWLFERVAPGAQLAEYLVHRADVALAVDRPLHVSEAALLGALRGIRRLPGVGARDRLRSRRWIATDLDWSGGRGPEVRAPALDVLLALAGRPSPAVVS